MRFLAMIPLFCLGAVTFCLTTVHGEADIPVADALSAEVLYDVDGAFVAEREFRDGNRAFYTAPPVIPHDLYPVSAGDCLTCHREEAVYFGKKSTRTPHPDWVNCTQCHMSARPIFEFVEADTVPTTWQGLSDPGEGTRAGVVAPPTMPHRKFLRENCQSCHSSESPFLSMRGPHPERSNCVQCHVADSTQEFQIDIQRALPTP